ncbi:MAG: type II transport protein [Thiotrichales bacterium]|jgi:type IV fimbrial biogenesis protein FimT|nr:type II transport protein [Thiotrichales bacterium]
MIYFKNISHEFGFTITEILITLALLATLMAQLTPDLSTMLQQSQLKSAAVEFSQALQLTRNEAIKRNMKVTICKSSSGSQCKSSVNWEDGWIIFENLDGDSRVDSNDTIFAQHNALPVGITLRGGHNFKNRVTYKATGDSTSFSSLIFCNNSELAGSQIIYINSTGRIRIAEDSDGDGIPENSDGANISSCG